MNIKSAVMAILKKMYNDDRKFRRHESEENTVYCIIRTLYI